MRAYLIKKLLLFIPLLLGITLLTFTLSKALPGDPVLSMVGERAQPEVIEKIRRELGTDKNILSQYIGYISLLIKGEFGRSYYTNRKVFDDLVLKFPNTLKLALGAMLIAVPFGLLFGFISAVKKDTVADRLISVVSVTGLSVPVFWSGLLIMLLFSLKLRLLPPSGTGDMRFLILPAITLSLPALATLSRVTRTSVGDTGDALYYYRKGKRNYGDEDTSYPCIKECAYSSYHRHRTRFWKLSERCGAHRNNFRVGRDRALYHGGHHQARLSCHHGVCSYRDTLFRDNKSDCRCPLSLSGSEGKDVINTAGKIASGILLVSPCFPLCSSCNRL